MIFGIIYLLLIWLTERLHEKEGEGGEEEARFSR